MDQRDALMKDTVSRPGQLRWRSYAVGFAHGQSAPTASLGSNPKPLPTTSQCLNTAVFANEHLKRLLDGAKRLDDGTKLRVRRPITFPILEKIVNLAPPPSTSLSMT
jgi:hypothetical protein